MNTDVRNLLIEIARKRQIIYYQELCDNCQLPLNMHDNPQDRLEKGRIIGEVSVHEFKQKRPLLSALVIARSGEEGDGFYKLCEDLGITSDWRKLKRDGIFAAQEIGRCHDFWRKDEYYKKYK